MPFFARKRLPSNPPPANAPASQSPRGLRQQPFPAKSRSTSQSNQQPQLVCTWSVHTTSQSGPSPSAFPRNRHTLTATATAACELFLFGGYVHGSASSNLYAFSTRDFSTTLLQTSGEAPHPRAAHGAALIDTTLLICGGKTSSGDQNVLNHDSIYLLNIVFLEWTRVVVNGPGPGRRYHNTINVVGSRLFVFGGQIGGNTVNDMWSLDLNCLKSQPVWESYEPTSGDEKPLPRSGHVSVTTGDHIIIFGGLGYQHRYNDTWSFDISTRKWTELQCTGSIPSPRVGHAAVLVDDAMYVFGGLSTDEGQYLGHMDDLYALQLSTQRWFKFHNEGPSPLRRSAHAMASDGTRVFVLGGYSKGARPDEISLVHVFETKDIQYPDPEGSVVNPDEKTTQFARKSSTGPPAQEQLQHPKSSSSEAHSASSLHNAIPGISDRPAFLQITHERNPGTNGQPFEPKSANSKPSHVLEDGVSEGSTKYHAGFAASHSSSEGRVASLGYERITQLERQLSETFAEQTERDQHIARLIDNLAEKSAQLEQAEANARLEQRERGVRLVQTSLVEQRDAELVEMQAKLDELVVSRDQQVGQYEKDLTNVRAKLEAKESELELIRLRLMDTEKGLAKSQAEADTLRAQIATGSMNRDEDQISTRRLFERMRALEAEVASKRWNEKSIEEMECRNEG